ncbi:hypothetical protein [Lactiplantibacillus mudanjiangensis]|nr:hypothetical protein [Lactiplantibacillus mudanjiangensis]
MMTQADQTRNRMNQIVDQLNPTNQTYFHQLTTYLMTNSLFTNETALNRQLLAMAQDLADAEHDGLDAEQYFGNAPQAMGDALLAQLPPAKLREHLPFLAVLIGISWCFLIISSPNIATGLQLNLLMFIIVPIVEIIMTQLIFKWFHMTTYWQRTNRLTNWITWFVNGLFWIVCVGIMVLLIFFVPTTYQVVIGQPWNLLILGLLAVIAVSYFGYQLYSLRQK